MKNVLPKENKRAHAKRPCKNEATAYRKAGRRSPDTGSFGVEDGGLVDVAGADQAATMREKREMMKAAEHSSQGVLRGSMDGFRPGRANNVPLVDVGCVAKPVSL
jgi:hypothetical protein